ncbi:UNVERIFIED_ORG: hypothetical protein J2W85_002093 [Ensifer adhaerens]|nr:hypothetical protein [Ensifer adhaerens]
MTPITVEMKLEATRAIQDWHLSTSGFPMSIDEALLVATNVLEAALSSRSAEAGNAMAQAAASDVETTASLHPVPKQGLPLFHEEGRTETVAGTDHPNFHESAKLSKSCHENTRKSAASARIALAAQADQP